MSILIVWWQIFVTNWKGGQMVISNSMFVCGQGESSISFVMTHWHNQNELSKCLGLAWL